MTSNTNVNNSNNEYEIKNETQINNTVQIIPDFIQRKYGEKANAAYLEHVIALTDATTNATDIIFEEFLSGNEYSNTTTNTTNNNKNTESIIIDDQHRISCAVAQACKWKQKQKKEFWRTLREWLKVQLAQELYDVQSKYYFTYILVADVHQSLTSNTKNNQQTEINFQLLQKQLISLNMSISKFNNMKNTDFFVILNDVGISNEDAQQKIWRELRLRTLASFDLYPEVIAVLERVATALFTYQTTGNIKDITEVYSDYLYLNQANVYEPEMHLFEYIDIYLHSKYFYGANVCQMLNCQCLEINTRDRSKANKISVNDLIMSSIHCALLHSFESGYRLTREELQMIADSANPGFDETEEEIEDEDAVLIDDMKDKQQGLIRDMVHQRTDAYLSLRHDVQNSKANKFVSIVEKHEHPKIDDDDNKGDDENEDSPKTKNRPPISYSFGLRLYYWVTFQHREELDKYYNGGEYMFCDWYIPLRFSSLKEELIQNDLHRMVIESWIDEQEKIEILMKSKYVKKLYLEKADRGKDYEIAENTKVSPPHILSICLYTNFTALCTAFSRVFRRIPETESDVSLKQRNSNYREWARLLVETIHVFGTLLFGSKIKTFYHGISIAMVFPATLACFCSPTSTTDRINIALDFASKSDSFGMVLELQNTNSQYLAFFDCIFSDFCNESEKLFMNGGIGEWRNNDRIIFLPFVSIRNLEFSINYKPCISAITIFGAIINKVWDNSVVTNKKVARMLGRLMRGELKTPASHFYAQSLFDEYCLSVRELAVDIQLLNLKTWNDRFPMYFEFRKYFCDLYSDEVLAANKEKWQCTKKFRHPIGYVNPVKNIKFDVFLDLCPNAKLFMLRNSPLSRFLMGHLLSFVLPHIKKTGHPMKKFIFFVIREIYAYTQHDFPPSDIDKCVAEYEEAFAEQGWKLWTYAKQMRYKTHYGIQFEKNVE